MLIFASPLEPGTERGSTGTGSEAPRRSHFVVTVQTDKQPKPEAKKKEPAQTAHDLPLLL